jgi:hypothetical protein
MKRLLKYEEVRCETIFLHLFRLLYRVEKFFLLGVSQVKSSLPKVRELQRRIRGLGNGEDSSVN